MPYYNEKKKLLKNKTRKDFYLNNFQNERNSLCIIFFSFLNKKELNIANTAAKSCFYFFLFFTLCFTQKKKMRGLLGLHEYNSISVLSITNCI